MAKKKAKWLEGSTLSIANAVVVALSGEEVTEKEITKALRGVEEIGERAAAEEANPTVSGLLGNVVGLAESIVNMANSANDLYTADLEAAGVETPEDEDDSEEDDVKETAPKEKKKKSKKVDKKEADNDEVDYESMSKKALRLAAKEAGIKTNKKMEKEELIEAIKNN